MKAPTKAPARTAAKAPAKAAKAPAKAPAKAAVKTPAKVQAKAPAKVPISAPAKVAISAPAKVAVRVPVKVETRDRTKPAGALFAVHHEKLLRKREDMLAMYRKDLRMGQETNDDPTEDIVDRANNSYSRELTFSLSDGERALLLQIEDALNRLDAGSYGRCAHCGETITALRLEALPWARLCIDCQELLEKGMLSEP